MSTVYQPEEFIQNKYRVTGVLGQGGVAITYSAVNLETNSPVAIKVISLKQLDNWKQVELFFREAEVLKQLNHPAIPKYIDYFDIETNTDKVFYLVQEIAPGKSLFQLVESDWHTDEKEIKDIAQQILSILSYLHSLDPPVIYRDLKPNNIIRNDEGKIYLVDFGAVQNTYYNTLMQGSTVVGTYGYMSPEQFRGQSLPQSDLYSLGATLLYLLTHRSPAELPQDTLKLDFRNSVDISDSFADWLEKILEPDIGDRFGSADVALVELFKNKKKKQGKLIADVSVIVLLISLIAGINSYKWFFLSRLGFFPNNLCSPIVLNHFIKQGGKIKAIDTDEIQDIFLCVIKAEDEYIQITKQLLLLNNNLHNTIDDSSLTYIHRMPLHTDIKQNKYKKIELPNSNTAIDNSNFAKAKLTPLHISVKQNKYETIELLIKHGANINAEDINRRTPLDYAIQNTNSHKTAKILIDLGADINAVNKSNTTFLHFTNNKDIANLLINSGIDVNVKNKYGRTPLFGKKDPEVIKIIIDNGGDVNIKDNDGKTPLHFVENIDAAKLLIDSGAEVNVKSKHGKTPLSIAISKKTISEKYENVAKLLVKYGAK